MQIYTRIRFASSVTLELRCARISGLFRIDLRREGGMIRLKRNHLNTSIRLGVQCERSRKYLDFVWGSQHRDTRNVCQCRAGASAGGGQGGCVTHISTFLAPLPPIETINNMHVF